MVNHIRRAVPLLAALIVLAAGLLGASCTTIGTSTSSTPQPTGGPNFSIALRGGIFQCSTGPCPPDIAWNGSTSISSTVRAAVANGDGLTCDVTPTVSPTDPNYTDCFKSVQPLVVPFQQTPRGAGTLKIAVNSIFVVHTSGLPDATSAPALGLGYYSVVQVHSLTTDPAAPSALVLYFVTFSANGQQRAAGAAAVQVPQQSAHVTVNMQTGGNISVLDGSNSTGSATPTVTTTIQ